MFVGFLRGSLFDPEDGSDMFLRISRCLQTAQGSGVEDRISFIN
jgi:hypothetical protein